MFKRICESLFKFDDEKSDEGLDCMNFLEWTFLWTMVATIVLGLISIIHIGFFKMNLLMKIKSCFHEIEGNRRKSFKLLFMHISRSFSELSKDTWILLNCFSRVTGNDLVAKKVGRMRMERNHKTVNASKAMDSGKLSERFNY